MFDDARAKIGETTKNDKKYSELLKGLILQVRSSLAKWPVWRAPS